MGWAWGVRARHVYPHRDGYQFGYGYVYGYAYGLGVWQRALQDASGPFGGFNRLREFGIERVARKVSG